MSDEINYHNNPLHGVGLKQLLTELVEHYGFEILYAYLNINCFKTNASIASSLKFLQKTEWAREKVEGFYLYQYKNLPRASAEQFELPPRERIVPENHKPREPAELSFSDAKRLKQKRAEKAEQRNKNRSNNQNNNRRNSNPNKPSSRDNRRKESTRPAKDSSGDSSDPWAKWR